jgi:hypothetical protein
MNNKKKVVKKVKRLHKVVKKTFLEYQTELRTYISRYGYQADVFEIMQNVMWHIVIYEKETKALCAVVKVGFKGKEHCTTYSVKLYMKEKTFEKDFIV